MNKFIITASTFIILLGVTNNVVAQKNDKVGDLIPIITEVNNKVSKKEKSKSDKNNANLPTQNKSKSKEIISNEKELTYRLNNATGIASIIIKGGIKIHLKDVLILDPSKSSKIVFKSSNNKKVILVSAENRKHFETVGTSELSLNFKNVILEGQAQLSKTGGGLDIKNNSDFTINGLILKNVLDNEKSPGIIYYKGNGGNLLIKNTYIENNIIKQKLLFDKSILYLDSKKGEIEIKNTVFNNNRLVGSKGSTLFTKSTTGKVYLTNVVFTNNKSEHGSGAYTHSGMKNSVLSLKNNKFKSNKTTFGDSGATSIKLDKRSIAYLDENKWHDNYAFSSAGALSIFGGKKIDIFNSTIKQNRAARINDKNKSDYVGSGMVGGINIYSQPNIKTNINIDNSIIKDNKAGQSGGISVVNNREGYTKLLINNSIIDNNIADDGGGGIRFDYSNSKNIKQLYRIINSKVTNNTASGARLSKTTFFEGNGGGIYYSNSYYQPDLMYINNVDFSNNKSNNPIYWSYLKNKTSTEGKNYIKNVKNVSKISDANLDLVDSFDNIYNGHDVYLTKHKKIGFRLNSEAFKNLEIDNYSQEDYKVRTVDNMYISKPKNPTALNYDFLGWYDEENNKWNFSKDVVNKEYFVLKAKWQLKQTYPVHLKLNGFPNYHSDIQVKKEYVEDKKIEKPNDITWSNVATFAGWYTKDKDDNFYKKWNFNKNTVKSDVVLHARWKVDVNFVIDGKEDKEYPKKVIDRENMLNLNSDQMEWYRDKKQTIRFNTKQPILKNTILYGKRVKPRMNNKTLVKTNIGIPSLGFLTILLLSLIFGYFTIRSDD